MRAARWARPASTRPPALAADAPARRPAGLPVPVSPPVASDAMPELHRCSHERPWLLNKAARLWDARLMLASTLPDSDRGFGTREQVDPVRRLILSASAWGGNP